MTHHVNHLINMWRFWGGCDAGTGGMGMGACGDEEPGPANEGGECQKKTSAGLSGVIAIHDQGLR